MLGGYEESWQYFLLFDLIFSVGNGRRLGEELDISLWIGVSASHIRFLSGRRWIFFCNSARVKNHWFVETIA